MYLQVIKVSKNINPTFCVSVDTVSNHVKPYWPIEAMTASDSEDPGGAERLKVETKVSVELHQENKLNHTGESTQDKDHPTPSVQANSNHQPEQRKGKSGKLTHLLSVKHQFNTIKTFFFLYKI